MSHCVLHVGLPKTATTLLQDRLFAAHPAIAYLGTYHRSAYRPFDKCRDAEVRAMLGELVFDRPRQPNLERARSFFASAVAPDLAAGKVPVWSWESLALSTQALRRARAENLRAVFGPCKVVVTLRHPLRLVESVYFQHLKRENVGGKYRRFRRPWTHSIESWLESAWGKGGAPDAHLDYANTIALFAEIFGRESVGVFLFEDLVADPDRFVRQLCAFIGVEPDLGVELLSHSRSNDRWNVDHLAAFQHIGDSAWKRWVFRLRDKQGRLRMIGLKGPVGTVEGARARAPLSVEWQARIAERTAPGNAYLEREWGVTLGRHRYPVRVPGESVSAGNCL